MSVALNTTTYPIMFNPHNKQSEYRTKQTQFGDGYREIALDGVNYEAEKYDLTFAPLSAADSLTLEGTLKNSVNGTSNCLSWTPPDQATTKYWIASDVRKQPISGTKFIVSCTLDRIYPL